VLSSIVAAWADIRHALENYGHTSTDAQEAISTLNAGYIWMLVNCLCTATYVLGMRKRIKLTNFKDFDSTFLSFFSSPKSEQAADMINPKPCTITTSSRFPSSSSPPS
jgi:GDP-mannose transporter